MTLGEQVETTHPLLVLSGPSGSGKTTIVDRLIQRQPVPLVKCISATTRPPREGEVDGEHYYYLSPEEFRVRRDRGEFLESAEVHGLGWYGTLKSEIQRAEQARAWPLLEIDVQGALDVMQHYPRTVSIFLKTPSDAEYEQRLRHRGTESDEVIERRLQTARDELQFVDQYQHCVVNGDIDQAVAEIGEILRKHQSSCR